MFERFSEASREVVVLAQDEARMLGHDYFPARSATAWEAPTSRRPRRAP
jgi:hypothetical protein